MLYNELSKFQGYDTKSFNDVFPDVEKFLADYNGIGIKPMLKSEDNVKTLYYLVYGKFGNSPIANWDETQFKYKLFTIIFQYGPTWEKKLDMQEKLRALNDEELFQGSKVINNHALNPGNIPGVMTGDPIELDYINDQAVVSYKKAKMNAYSELWSLLSEDVSEFFLQKFSELFLPVVRPKYPILYENEEI